MYNAHRGLPPSNSSRVLDLLDQVRQEFETTSRSSGEIEHQSTPLDFLPGDTIRMRCEWQIGLTAASSDWADPGAGDDPTKGLPAGAGPGTDETRVCFVFHNPSDSLHR